MTKKKSQPSKRQIEEDPSTEVEVKRAKMENGTEMENKPIFQRIKSFVPKFVSFVLEIYLPESFTHDEEEEEEEEDLVSESETHSSECDSEIEPAATKTTPPAAMAKNLMFQRLWSEEDEIMLLEGMIDFSRDTCTSVYDDMNGFFEKHKDSISFDVKSVNQFVKKIWSLKNKYFLKRRSRVSTNVHVN
ncbi:GLABROUS1 enhancer-binding protein family [Arabidopsis thaliana x Arabidopsis arenosa]|uniref:GLABROUS1 enhancer-binding protein family n=1 Tax=Arabidopsis thaliana x Arabidopsis arenosa TaxID=1240361 RepID=A0A8T1ZL72_9BRAS|nr:GLABROUS1 enhancer-binding protein family [Arabidopsis thaliana x Arabidopsis arenosa]